MPPPALHRRATCALVTGVLVTALGVGAGILPAVRADPTSDRKASVDEQVAQVRENLEGASQDLVEAAVKLRRAQSRLVDARAALTQAQARLAQARALDADLASRLAYAQAQQDKAVRDLSEGEDAQRETRTALGRIARDAYLGNRLVGLSVALQAESPDQFADRMAVARAALESQVGTADRLAVAQADLRARGAKVEALESQVAELKRRSAAQVAARQAAEREARTAEQRITGLVAAERSALVVIKGKVAAERSRLGALEKEQAKLRAVLAARAAAARARARAKARAEAAARAKARDRSRPSQGDGGGGSAGGGGGGGGSSVRSGGFLSYAAPGPITSPFGRRYHPVLHYWRLHSGIDFGTPCGTPVRASASGTVVTAGWGGGYGNRIVVDHGLVGNVGLATTYNHLSRIVKRSGSVRRGQLIGYAGTTGLSTGCHLHFETLADGAFVDPMRYL